MNSPNAKLSGFTLIELTITLFIAITLIAFVVPSFSEFTQQTRLTMATHDLHSAMNLARTEAIKRNGRVDLIANDGNWRNGWKIVAEDEQLYNHEPLHKDISVRSTFLDKTKQYIAYNGTGRTRSDKSTEAPMSGTISLSIGKHSRILAVNFMGRVRACNPATARSCVDPTL